MPIIPFVLIYHSPGRMGARKGEKNFVIISLEEYNALTEAAKTPLI